MWSAVMRRRRFHGTTSSPGRGTYGGTRYAPNPTPGIGGTKPPPASMRCESSATGEAREPGAGAAVGGEAGAGVCETACTTSSRVTRPCSPVGCTRAMSTPISCASLRVDGDERRAAASAGSGRGRRGGGQAAGAGAAAGAGDAAGPSVRAGEAVSSMRQSRPCLGTTVPAAAAMLVTTPFAGATTSVSALSVATSRSTWSRFT